MKILIYIVAWTLILIGIFPALCGGLVISSEPGFNGSEGGMDILLFGIVLILFGIMILNYSNPSTNESKLNLFFLAIYIYLKTGVYPGINPKNKENNSDDKKYNS